jgi:hypothetical protein
MKTFFSRVFVFPARASHALALFGFFAMPPAARASTGFTASDTLDGNDLGKELRNGTVYVVPQNATIARPSTSANSALYVNNNSTAVIYIPSNVTLTVKGGNAQGTEGAGAGIRLNSGATLVVTGQGKLDVTGGSGAGQAGRAGRGGRERGGWVLRVLCMF